MKQYILKTGLAIAMLVAFCAKAGAFTAVASGNWSSAATWGGTAQTGTVTAADIVIPSSIHVVLDMDVTFSGAINSFTVNGSLDNTTDHMVTIAQGSLTGSGTIAIAQVTFQTLATSTFSGTMNLKRMMNSGATLVLTAIANVTDTLDLDAGSIVLNTGANLTMKANSTVRINSGTLTVTGGLLNTGNPYNVLYVGVSKTSGVELNSSSIQNLYVKLTDNSQKLTIATNLVVNGMMNLTSGAADFTAQSLTLMGDLKTTGGAMFTSSSSSSLVIKSTASLTSGLYFTASSMMKDLTIEMSNNGQAKLMTALGITGSLKLMSGSLNLATGAALTMAAASLVHIENGMMSMTGGSFVGTAAYNVEYMGGANTTGPEVSGSGLNNVTVSLVSATNTLKMMGSVKVAGMLHLASGKLDLNGDTLTANGSLMQTPSAAFIGNASSTLNLNLTSATNDTLFFDAANQTLKKLQVNLANGGNVVLATMLTIKSELDLTKGMVVLLNYDLQIAAAAVINGYNNANYIATEGPGRLQMTVNSGSSYVTFPVGSITNYSPAYLQQTASGSSGNFMVRVFQAVLTSGTVGYNTANSASVVNRTWMFDAATGVNVNLNMKLGWVAGAEVNGFNRSQSYISHYHNSAWDTYAVASASAGVNSTFELTRTGLTSLSPFAVSDMNAAMGIPVNVNAASVDMFPNPATDYLNIQITNAGGANYLYEVIDVTGRIVLSVANNNSLNRFPVSDFNTGCYFIKATNLDSHTVTIKRFIKS
jgi:hypothetical protein